MKTLLIDDMRTLEVDRIERTFDGGICALAAQHWETLYLDHDLGDKDERKTGYGIMCWLEQNPQHLPENIVIITSNPAGRQYMELVRRKLYNLP
jgi:hypothetical protein